MDELIQHINEVGFPILVSTFVLIRIENKPDTLRVSIEKLPEQIKEQRVL